MYIDTHRHKSLPFMFHTIGFNFLFKKKKKTQYKYRRYHNIYIYIYFEFDLDTCFSFPQEILVLETFVNSFGKKLKRSFCNCLAVL